MKRLHWLGALTASALLFSAAAGADDRHERRNWDRDRHHSDRWDRGDHWRGRDGRWDDRRYHHSRPDRYWVRPGHRYGHGYGQGYRHGYRDNRYHGGYRRDYYGGRHYYPPRYHRSSIDGTLILSFPIW